MHVSLSDVLTCPACEGGHGMILLTDLVEERRVVKGVLGCPNCRARYPIRERIADLRSPEVRAQSDTEPEPGPGTEPRTETDPEQGPGTEPRTETDPDPATGARRGSDPAQDPGPDPSLRLAAALGLERVRGVVALAGPAAGRAAAISGFTDQVEIVALVPGSIPSETATGGWSTLRVDGPRLPFRNGVLAGVALTGGSGSGGELGGLLDEAIRSLRPAGRLVLEPADRGLLERAQEAGMLVMVDDPVIQVLARRS